MLELVIIILLYFFPTVVAILSRRRNTLAIAVLNTLLGRKFFGWAIALVWACCRNK